VGEAATRVSFETRRRYPGIPWQDIIGMRHRLVHGHDAVDQGKLWDTLVDDLPALIADLERTLEAEAPSE